MQPKTILQLILTPLGGFLLAAIVAGLWESAKDVKIEFGTFEMLALWGVASAVVYVGLERWWFSRNE